MKPKEAGRNVARGADMLNALGAEPHLRILRLLLSAHPGGMVVGGVQIWLDAWRTHSCFALLLRTPACRVATPKN